MWIGWWIVDAMRIINEKIDDDKEEYSKHEKTRTVNMKIMMKTMD